MTNPFEVLRIWGLEKLGRYYSQYRAIVVDSQPDDKNIGNIMVHIPRVQGGMKIVARSKASIGGPGYGKRFFLPTLTLITSGKRLLTFLSSFSTSTIMLS